MVVILTDEDLEFIENGNMVKVKTVVDVPAGGTFGIATQKWVDEMDKKRRNKYEENTNII